MANDNQVKESIEQLQSIMKKSLLIQMSRLSKESSEYADNLSKAYKTQIDINNLQNATVKKLQEENRLDEYNYKIQEKLVRLKKEEKDGIKARIILEEKIKKIKEKSLKNEQEVLEEVKKLREEGLDIDEKSISSQKDLLKCLEHKKNIIARNVKISREQHKILGEQIKKYKEGMTILGKISKISAETAKSLWSYTKGWIGQLASFYSFGKAFHRSAEHLKAYEDGMWNLGVSLRGNNDDLAELNRNIGEYESAFRKASMTAARFGVENERVREAMSQLTTKVHFLKKEFYEGIREEKTLNKLYNTNGVVANRLDVDKLGQITEMVTVFARTMGMDLSEAIDMYSNSIRKLGMTSKQAIKYMSDVQASAVGFNSILVNSFANANEGFDEFENVAMFANDIGRAMLELQQGTRYWVQDLQMLNTQFNAYINLLIRQGKSQQQALALAKAFQNNLQEPGSDLVKFNIGKELDKRISSIYNKAKKENKDISKEELTLKGAEAMGLAKVIDGKLQYVDRESKDLAEKVYYLMNERKDTGFTRAMTLQEMLGGTGLGMMLSFDERKKWSSKDLTVQMQSLGLAKTREEALDLVRLMQRLEEHGLQYTKDPAELARANAIMDIDDKFGRITKDGKASKELIESYLEYEKKNRTNDKVVEELEQQNNLSVEEKALLFRKAKIQELSKQNEEVLKQERKIEENTGKVLVQKDGFESSIKSDVKSAAEWLQHIYVLLAASLVLQNLGAFTSVGKGLFGALKNIPKLKNIIPKFGGKSKLPKTPNVKPSGTIKEATKKVKLTINKQAPIGNTYRDMVTGGKQANTFKPTPFASTEKLNEAAKNLKNSAKVIEKSSTGIAAKTAGKLGAKTLGKFGVGTDVAMGLGFAYSRMKGGDTAGAVAEGFSSSAKYIGAAIGTVLAPGIGTIIGGLVGSGVGILTDGVLAIRDWTDKDKLSYDEKIKAFEEFNKVSSSMALLPENIDSAIEEYANQIQGLSEKGLDDLKDSIKKQYVEALNEPHDTKNPEAILLRKKIEYGNANQEKLIKQQLDEEKKAYEQLDEIGKVISNQEKLFKLHDKWFDFAVETEVRNVMMNKDYSERERNMILKGMQRGAAGRNAVGDNRIEKSVDASGVETWKVVSKGMTALGNKDVVGMYQ